LKIDHLLGVSRALEGRPSATIRPEEIFSEE